MSSSINVQPFQIRTAEYFSEKARQLKGPEKLLVALEKSRYLADALQHGLTFNDLKELGFKFATV